jgi:hypothetical protein
MATAIQQPSVFNVEASVNAHFRTSLAAVTKPAWLPTLPTIQSIPLDDEAALPAFTLSHIPVGFMDKWQGRHVGGGLSGMDSRALLDISCWVSRRDNPQWMQQLRTMEDMVLTVATQTATIVIMDYAANLSSPSATSFLVRLSNVVTRTTQPDPNPNIERKRVLVEYDWVYRST